MQNNSKSNLETDLTISEDNSPIEEKGKGRQCFIKTEFALAGAESRLNAILLEEPENHLSHTHTNKLITRIRESENKQLFIATHSDLISARLDLRKAILLNSMSTDRVLLSEIDEKTAKFFMKAPDNNILEFILSPKVILVEGDAEFMLMESFFKIVLGSKPENVHVISVDGTSFEQYLKLARILGVKTVVLRDNDGDYPNNCVERYSDFDDVETIKVFSDPDDAERTTFEIAVYLDNQTVCDALFSPGRRTLTPQEYMLKNKAEAAFQLLLYSEERPEGLPEDLPDLVCPQYIKEAIEWING